MDTIVTLLIVCGVLGVAHAICDCIVRCKRSEKFYDWVSKRRGSKK